MEESESSWKKEFSDIEIQVANILVTMPETILTREKQRKEAEAKAMLRDKRHVCHICNKSFDTGMALGGHMSGHRLESMQKEGASTTTKASTEVEDEEVMRAKEQRSNPLMCSSSSNEMQPSAPTTAVASSSEDSMVAKTGMTVEPRIHVCGFNLNELPKFEQ
ncbi:hypothetical protein HPP92_000442 [Vanilla planifolia]|uniref:C2H2-type domain-containing protein n=1 Tax=Vanilla planifolia TaxID=51239 RepID=A0A835S4U5_VANPL|nr:hypothetical protein HPP92_000442 [Vanilla planifolia]